MAPHVIVGFVFYKNEGWVNAWRLGSKLKIFKNTLLLIQSTNQ